MAPRRRQPSQPLQPLQPLQPSKPSEPSETTISFTDEQFKRLLNALIARFVPNITKISPVHFKSAPKASVTPPDQQEQHNTSYDTQQESPQETQMPLTPPQQIPQPIATQPSEQRAPPAAVRFLEKVDYKYDGPCNMRHRKLSFNTVNLMMSTPSSNHLIQLRYQARKGSHFTYFWSNSRPPGIACHILTRLNLGDHGNRLRLGQLVFKKSRLFPGS